MYELIKLKNGKRQHLYNPNNNYTVCGKRINWSKVKYSQCLPRDELYHLCDKCYAEIGREMVDEYFGLAYAEDY